MDTFPSVKRKDEKEYGEYRTKRRILEIYDPMTPLTLDGRGAGGEGAIYHSLLNPPPCPPCDAEGNFIPVEEWDINNWPSHIHLFPIDKPWTHK